jgi:hypothetical protein
VHLWGTIFAENSPGHRGDMASDEQKNGKTEHPDSRPNSHEIKELTENEEPSIDVLQWYLKMIIDSEEDPKPKK